MIDIEQLKAAIGKRLRAAREAKGMSQEELANRLGLTKVGYGALERGKNLIGLQYLIMLTYILERPITDLLPTHAFTQAELNDLFHDPQFQAIMSVWPDLTPHHRNLVHDLAVSLREVQIKKERGAGED